ncbi:MAG: hypothetical protein M5R36_08650 [Deltaproteobacteria bacterium]|nr:hypothetical protein [Deltaproteobacteria bacterium]
MKLRHPIFFVLCALVVLAGAACDPSLDDGPAEESADDITVEHDPDGGGVNLDEIEEDGPVPGTRLEIRASAVVDFSDLVMQEAAVGPPIYEGEAPWVDYYLNDDAAPLPERGGPEKAGPPPLVPGPSPTSSFQALLDNNTTIPPDTHGAAGPDHLMTVLNSQVRIQSKTGTNLGTVTLDVFWSSLGADAFDPKVLYDQLSGRWIFTACANAASSTSGVLIGASATDDPTGTWYLYFLDGDSGNTLWVDYPSFGYNKDWVVVSVNMFTISGNAYSTTYLFVFDKADLYAGGAVDYTRIDYPQFTMVPAQTFDASLDRIYVLRSLSGKSVSIKSPAPSVRSRFRTWERSAAPLGPGPAAPETISRRSSIPCKASRPTITGCRRWSTGTGAFGRRTRSSCRPSRRRGRPFNGGKSIRRPSRAFKRAGSTTARQTCFTRIPAWR